MTALARIWAAITGARDWLLLLAIGAVVAWGWAQIGALRADRDALLSIARQACAAVGSDLEPKDAPRGRGCVSAIVAMKSLQSETDRETANVLAQAMQDRNGKLAADAASARADAQAAAAARQRMEAADAATEDDRVGSHWLSAFNNLAGLH